MHVLKAGVEMNYGWRVGVVITLIVVMAIALASLLLRDSDAATAATTLTPTTTSLPATTTSTSTSTTTAATTTTTINPEARIAEVELILEDLYVRWFDAIYRKDESALPDIVALQRDYDAAIQLMETLAFIAPPNPTGITVEVQQLTLDRRDCIAAEFSIDASLIRGFDLPGTSLQILWPHDGGWRLARNWSGPGDLWQIDCDVTDRTEIP